MNQSTDNLIKNKPVPTFWLFISIILDLQVFLCFDLEDLQLNILLQFSQVRDLFIMIIVSVKSNQYFSLVSFLNYLTGSSRNSKHGSRQSNKYMRYVSGFLLDSLFISYNYCINFAFRCA